MALLVQSLERIGERIMQASKRRKSIFKIAEEQEAAEAAFIVGLRRERKRRELKQMLIAKAIKMQLTTGGQNREEFTN